MTKPEISHEKQTTASAKRLISQVMVSGFLIGSLVYILLVAISLIEMKFDINLFNYLSVIAAFGALWRLFNWLFGERRGAILVIITSLIGLSLYFWPFAIDLW